MSYFPTRRGPPPQNQESAYGPAMTDASIYPFKWTPAFGTRMRQLRRQLGDPPYEIVEDAGGPTVLEQTFIEKGPSEGVSPGWVIEDTLRQYATAYVRLCSPRDSDVRELCKSEAKSWKSPFFVDERFVMALGEAGAAASDPDVLEDRGRQIDQAARRFSGDRDRFVLGALPGGDVVNASGLKRFGPECGVANIAKGEAKVSGEQFYQHIARVAGRHPTISVAHALWGGKTLARHWHNADAVKRNIGRLDPIDGIRNLTAARQRAIALKANEARVDAVALMIVLINALTDQLNAETTTAEARLTALDTWRRHKTNLDKWTQLIRSLPSDMYWGAAPDIKIMVLRTAEMLGRWEYTREDCPYELTYELCPDKQIQWIPREVGSPLGLSQEAGDLWLLGERPGTYSDVLALIGDMGNPALHFREDEELVTIDSTSRYAPVQWCPSGIMDNIALVHGGGGRWRAVQIY